jgi:hypothetical protein
VDVGVQMAELPEQGALGLGVARVELPHLGIEQVVEELALAGMEAPSGRQKIRFAIQSAVQGSAKLFVIAAPGQAIRSYLKETRNMLLICCIGKPQNKPGATLRNHSAFNVRWPLTNEHQANAVFPPFSSNSPNGGLSGCILCLPSVGDISVSFFTNKDDWVASSLVCCLVDLILKQQDEPTSLQVGRPLHLEGRKYPKCECPDRHPPSPWI